jgi:hypothetical protein
MAGGDFQVGDINLKEPDSEGECWIGLRGNSSSLILAVSKKSDGDVEVAMAPADAAKLIELLALGLARREA